MPATSGPLGELRFDPFAMLPFYAYDTADHWQHRLDIGEQLARKNTADLRVNWFRKDEDGLCLWPGFCENFRVLDWVTAQLENEVDALSSPIGLLPYLHDLDLRGLALPDEHLRDLLTIDAAGWRRECVAIQDLFDQFGDGSTHLIHRLTRLRWTEPELTHADICVLITGALPTPRDFLNTEAAIRKPTMDTRQGLVSPPLPGGTAGAIAVLSPPRPRTATHSSCLVPGLSET